MKKNNERVFNFLTGGKSEHTLLLLCSQSKAALEECFRALQSTNLPFCTVTRNEIAAMMLEALQEDKERTIIKKCAEVPLVILFDVETLAGKTHAQTIVCDILEQRQRQSLRTVVLSLCEPWVTNAFSEEIFTLFRDAEKYEI